MIFIPVLRDSIASVLWNVHVSRLSEQRHNYNMGALEASPASSIIVGFPALCLALLSTQTCRCCNYLKPHKTSPSTIGVYY